MHCSEMTRPEAILCEGRWMELMSSSSASFASLNMARKKPQQLTEAHWETPCVFQLSRQRCHPRHALPRPNNSCYQNLIWNSVEEPGSTTRTALHLTPLSCPALGGPGAAGGTGCERGTEPGAGDTGPRCEGTMPPVRGSLIQV